MTLYRFPRIPSVIAAVMTALVATSCASGSVSGSSAGVEKPDLVAAVVPAIDSAGFYIAAQRGLFAAQGLHVKIVPAISSETVIADQLRGKYDITLGNYVSYIQWETLRHARLRILCESSVMQPRTQELLVPPSSPIRSIDQLKGKKIGVNVPNNIIVLLVSSVLADSGIKPSDVHLVPIPFPFMAGALKAHKIDAAEMPEPFVTATQVSIGAQTLFDADQGATQNLPIAGVVVTQAWAKRYPRTAAALRRAVEEGQAIADTNRSAVEKAMVKYVPHMTPQAAALLAEDNYPLGIKKVRIQRIADLMLRFGLLKHPFDVTPMLH
ncbi:MAG: ABC transporter substrate-binding protein [Micromonosporaceae bacterium]